MENWLLPGWVTKVSLRTVFSALHNALYCCGVPYQTNIWRLFLVRHQTPVWSCLSPQYLIVLLVLWILRDHNERHLCQGYRIKKSTIWCVSIIVLWTPHCLLRSLSCHDSSTWVLTFHYNNQSPWILSLFCLQEKIKPMVPIVHFKSAKPPFIICMKLVRILAIERNY